MNKRILRLAIPNVISNITIPLLGLVSTAMAGALDSDAAIAAVGIGAAIFGFIYWNCGFLRMGTSGLTAQALGARNLRECANMLVRSVAVALGLAALLLIFQGPVGRFSISIMDNGDGAMSDNVIPMVAEYFFARVWAAPATISLYAIQGWYIGMQNSKTPMYVSIAINLINILFSYIFVFHYDMGVAGIAYGTVVAQYSGALISWTLWYIYYRRFLKYIDWKESLKPKPMFRFFNVNKDIFLRTACNVFVYTFFTVASTHYDTTIVATNTILIHLFTFFSYMADGFGYAAEALTGRFTGARNFKSLRHSIINMFWWSGGIAVSFVLIYRLFWKQILGLFTDSPSIIGCAGDYIVWIMVVPLIGFAPFLMDGILIGATKTRILRNSMALSTLLFFGLYYLLADSMGNDALWLSFIVFLISRGVNQYFMSNRLEGLLWHKNAAKAG